MLEVLPSSHFVRSQCTERDSPKILAEEDGPFSSYLLYDWKDSVQLKAHLITSRHKSISVKYENENISIKKFIFMQTLFQNFK